MRSGIVSLTKDKSCSQIAVARAVRLACRFANLTAFERSVIPWRKRQLAEILQERWVALNPG
jgi:hypothetical protein